MARIPECDNREEYLLRVCFELLRRQYESPYVLNMLHETVVYDGAECDGYCLMDDIAMELDIDADEYKADEATSV